MEYYKDNNEKERRKQYRENNKERINQLKKKYYQNNKEELKEYYKNNKEKINEKQKEKFDCECGGKYTYSNKSGHEKTNKHKKFIK